MVEGDQKVLRGACTALGERTLALEKHFVELSLHVHGLTALDGSLKQVEGHQKASEENLLSRIERLEGGFGALASRVEKMGQASDAKMDAVQNGMAVLGQSSQSATWDMHQKWSVHDEKIDTLIQMVGALQTEVAQKCFEGPKDPPMTAPPIIHVQAPPPHVVLVAPNFEKTPPLMPTQPQPTSPAPSKPGPRRLRLIGKSATKADEVKKNYDGARRGRRPSTC